MFTATRIVRERVFRSRHALNMQRSLWCIVLLAVVVLAAARPQEFDDEDESSQAGDRKDDVSRVQIKVYRGPTKQDGYAPWGFWVKQPSDEEK